MGLFSYISTVALWDSSDTGLAEKSAHAYLQDDDIDILPGDRMLLDVLLRLKEQDPTLSMRKSCREGVCGSDAMNINGRNGLACITRVRELKAHVVRRPLPAVSDHPRPHRGHDACFSSSTTRSAPA